jgi:hypothetical protein
MAISERPLLHWLSVLSCAQSTVGCRDSYRREARAPSLRAAGQLGLLAILTRNELAESYFTALRIVLRLLSPAGSPELVPAVGADVAPRIQLREQVLVRAPRDAQPEDSRPTGWISETFSPSWSCTAVRIACLPPAHGGDPR